jgi:3-dehydroquinate dehydratase II
MANEGILLMIKILVLNGSNLNLLGAREPEIYGDLSLEEINNRISKLAVSLNAEITFFQSNLEGALIDKLQDSQEWASGVIFNPGGYAHTSVALRDAILALKIPVIEVHMSNIFAREKFRHFSMTGSVCKGMITGLGWLSYEAALYAMVQLISNN